MGLLYFVNHFNAKLATSIAAGDAVLTLDLTDAFTPTIPSGGRVPLTILDPTNPASFEVVYCTAATGTQFTVIRGMEGTTAAAWAAGVSVIAPPTAGTQQLFTQAGFTPIWSSTIANQIGGYQIGARVQDNSGVLWQSTASNNMTQPGVSGASWVKANGGTVPVGTVIDYAGLTPPDGWLACYGQAVSRTTYSDLFTALGVLYGSGDGSTTFNLPDFRGRGAFGQDNMGGNAAGRLTTDSGINGTVIGASGGSQYLQGHTHAINDPGHVHGVNDPGHVHPVGDPGHIHFSPNGGGFVGPQGATGNTNAGFSGGSDVPEGTYASTGASLTGIAVQGAATNISIAVAGTGITTASAGLGGGQNMPPTLVVNKLIYTGVT